MKEKHFTVVLNSSNGKWRIAAPQIPGVRLKNLRTRLWMNNCWVPLFRQGPQGIVRQLHEGRETFVFEEKSGKIAASLSINHPKDSRYCVLQLKLKNLSNSPISLGPLHLIEFADVICPARGTRGVKVFVDSGGGWWAGVVDITSSSPFKEQWELLPEEDKQMVRKLKGKNIESGFHNSSGGISALYEPENKSALIAGFLTFNRTANNVTWLYREKEEFLYGWAGCNFAGFHLKPHESIFSEKLFLGFYDSPLSGLEEYAAEAAKAMKVKLPKVPPMGWCSWYAYRFKINEKNTAANAKLIKKHFPGYPFSYIQVDHGWQYKNTCGYWTETNERFPRGIGWLADKLDKTGFKLGLWLGVFTVLESSPLFKEHPEYLIKNRTGKPKPMPYRWAWPPQDRVYYLDPTHPGTQKFIRETFAYLRKAGARYWKIDFTWGIALNDPDAVYYDKTMVKGAEIYRKGLSLIEETLKGDYIYWCSNPLNLGFGLGSTSMSACDIGNTGFSLAKKVEGRTENLDFFLRNATTIISRYFLHKKLVLLNPDVVEVGKPGDYEEAKIRLSLVAFSGGQVFLGDDLTLLKDRDWNLLSRCIPPLGEAARPVDLFEHTYPSSYPHIWHLPVKADWGKWDMAGLFNLAKKSTEITVDFSALNLKKDKDYLVFEFWSKKFLGRAQNSVRIKMSPVTTKLLLFKEVPAHPIVLSTDMHFSQGGVELEDVIYDGNTQTLKGTARRQTGAKGNIFIFLPSFYEVKETVPVIRKQKDVIALPVDFKKSAVKWEVKFYRR